MMEIESDRCSVVLLRFIVNIVVAVVVNAVTVAVVGVIYGFVDSVRTTFPFRLELDFVQSVQIASLSGVFEGKWRTSLSGQVEVRPITVVRIDFNDLLQQWRQASGKIRAPAGHHLFDSQLAIGEECPGTFSGKNGHVDYAFVIKIRLTGRFGYTEFVETRPVNVIPVVDLTQFAQHLLPVTRCKTFRKKVFCINKANANVIIRLDKAAFIQGESVAISGEIINEHPTNVLKGGLVELIMSIRYICKRVDKTFNASVVRFAISAVPPRKHVTFEHYFQIPLEAFPTYVKENSLIQTSYQLAVSVNECQPFDIPVIIGTKSTTMFTPRRFLAITEIPSIPKLKAEHEPPIAQTIYPAYFPAPPPPYAFPYPPPPPPPSQPPPPSNTQFMPSYIPYRTARQQCYLSPQHYYQTTSDFVEPSVLQIEEIE
ncbi:unnamed protein product [Enterobius vermicularis]|uniref:Arrestin_C domain-containing protein n=1 Tax=Enterobius vermicularis TaxID=51028 RepID=A0A0N4VMH6_ENTVE|nr:unnamed protein product [Enterobius vermicularis]